MNTIKHFHNIANGFDRITSGMSGLEAEFKYVAPVTDLDKAQIDVMIASAQNLIAAAEALKSVVFEGQPDPVVLDPTAS
jgi:hypothetical protein